MRILPNCMSVTLEKDSWRVLSSPQGRPQQPSPRLSAIEGQRQGRGHWLMDNIRLFPYFLVALGLLIRKQANV
jgi:hypothetical protein